MGSAVAAHQPKETNMSNHTITSRPWWISHALQTDRGVVVARAQAISNDVRNPTDEDIASGIACNRYDSSTQCHGELVSLMVGLTEDDLQSMGLTPGELVFPGVVDGPRPRTNRSNKPVTMAQAQRAMDVLQSEGHCDDHEAVDNTPWQKGDDVNA
jgi:hypothetical protein